MSSYERSHVWGHDSGRAGAAPEAAAAAPGKQTLAEQLPAGAAIQRKSAGASAASRATGGDWMSVAFSGGGSLVQRRVAASASGEAQTDQVHEAAQRGIAGGGGNLPYLGLIQQSFGRHDVGGVQAHTGGAASEATAAMGATAYATGNHVAFGGAPDLHTAAHEAAHVVQQRAGVHLKGGVGAEGDEHERHADAVADRVVAGQSSEDLLDRYAAPGGAAADGAAVQGKAVQRAVKGQKQGDPTVKDCNTLKSLFDLFEIADDEKRQYALRMKDLLFTTAVFPAEYQAQFATNPDVKDEIAKLVTGFMGELVKASASPTVVSVAANDGTALANQLFPIIGGGVDAAFAKAKCPRYATIRTGATGLVGGNITSYLDFMKGIRAQLKAYEDARNYKKFDQETLDKNAQLDNRIAVLKVQANGLDTKLNTELAANRSPAGVLTEMANLQRDIALLEPVMDLEFEVGKDENQQQLTALTTDTTEFNSYAPGGGTPSVVAVKDDYSPLMACSLFSLLELVPGFMGAAKPEDLHKLLRRSGKLKQYDDDQISAQIRFAAGLTPTMHGGRRLGDFIQKEIFDKGGDRPSFIVDPVGEAHTFAVAWASGAYHPKDNQSSSRDDIMGLTKWSEKRMGSTWMKGT